MDNILDYLPGFPTVDDSDAALVTPAESRTASLPTGVVTFLLSDVEGSTYLWEGDEDLMRAATTHSAPSPPSPGPRARRRRPN